MHVRRRRSVFTFLFFVSILVITSSSTTPAAAAGPWYVAPGGSDSNDCDSIGAPCETINGAIGKATAGDIVYITDGVYTGTGTEVVLINKDITLSGGWDPAFLSQTGLTTIDGEITRRGITINGSVVAAIDRFSIRHGASNEGGGIFVGSGSGSTTLTDSVVARNSATSGGGIFIAGGNLNIINSAVSGNSANGGGGINNLGGTLTIHSSTISGNSVSTMGGGGIRNEGGTTTLQNSILAGNMGDFGPDCNNDISSAGYTLVGDTTNCTFTSTTGDLLNVNPNLKPLEDYGGNTLTHALSPGSPAINAGDPAGCSDHLSAALTADQRGAPRVGRCDIGSYEAGLVARKEVSGEVSPGSEVTFTITLSSEEGSTGLTGVSLTDDLSPTFTYVSGSYSDNNGTGGESGGVITWNGTVSPSTATVISFNALISAGLAPCSVVENDVSISHDVGYEFEQHLRLVLSCPICGLSKYLSNPVLSVGTSGSWDDDGVWHPSVLLDGATYMMWYAGNDDTYVNHIGLATSPDGYAWTKEGGNPVLTVGSPGSWDESGVSRPSMMLDGSTYKMWFTGVDSSGVIQIGYATSLDGITWTKHPGNPVLAVGSSGSWEEDDVSGPTVLKDNGTYHMWYAGNDGATFRIGHATSSNGVTWVKDPANPVLDLGPTGAWDWLGIYSPDVVKIGDSYKLWYSGETLPQAWQTGYAESPDGTNWTRKSMLIPEGPPGTFDTNSADHAAVLLDGASYRIWYAGIDDGGTYTIGHAEAQLCSGGAYTLYLPLVMKDYSPGPPCPPDYLDDFSDPTSGWYIGEDADAKFDYTGGEYQIWAKNVDSWWLVTPGAKATDFTAAVSARRLSGLDGAYGIIFGISDDWSSYYEVLIDNAYYSIWRWSGSWSMLMGWTFSSDIATGTTWNRLKVIREGSNISVHINDAFQTTVIDGTLTGWRRIGLVAASPLSDPMDFRFDDFALYPASCGPLAADTQGFQWGEAEAHEGIIPPKPALVE